MTDVPLVWLPPAIRAPIRPMSKSVRRVEQAAQSLGLEITVRRMAASTRTAEEAAAACGCEAGQIVKSLIFQGESGLILLLVSGANRVDTDHVARAIGERLTRADASKVRAETGFAIGGVAPIGHLTPPRTWMDPDLLEHAIVWAAAGAPDAVFAVAPATLRRAANATVLAMSAPG